MKLKDHAWQLTSLESAKKLKELGVKQESLWWWTDYLSTGTYGLAFEDEIKEHDTTLEHSFSAFTVPELGEMLPNDKIIRYIEKMGGLSKGRSIKTTQWGDKCLAYIIMDLLKNPNNMAKMVIYLKEKI